MTTTSSDIDQEIIALERAALDRWCEGDPSGFLEICAPDVTYFDPFLPRRIDGLEALTSYYEQIRGQVSAPQREIVEPRVQHLGSAAILTFRFVSRDLGGREHRWNCTEVYRHDAAGWRIVQTHWSFTGASV